MHAAEVRALSAIGTGLTARGLRDTRRPTAAAYGEPLALLDLPQSREYFLGLFAAAGIEPNVRYRTTSVETARALVGLGLACTLLNLRPKMSTSLDGHEVIPVALAEDGSALDVVMLTAAAGRPTRRAAAVAALCVEVLRRAPPRSAGPMAKTD